MKAAGISRWHWHLFIVGLLAAIFGWLMVLQRLVTNEAEVAQARVNAAEERLLGDVAEGLVVAAGEQLPQDIALSELPAVIARDGKVSGIWFERGANESINFDEDVVEKWRAAIRTDSVSSKEFVAALTRDELAWGWVEEGRDVVAGMVLSLLRKSESPELVSLLRDRVWSYEGANLNPGFRILMIKELQRHDADPALESLLEIESIFLAEGNPGRDDALGPFEVIEITWNGQRVRSFWTKSQLEDLVKSAKEVEVELLAKVDGGRAAVRLPGLTRWPMMALAGDDLYLGTSVKKSGAALLWVGGLTGLAVLALTIMAAVMAGRASKVARMRTDLAASVAHELRTPLAGQRLLLESLMEREDQSEEEKREYVAMAFRENKRLSRLAEEFLTFSRLERGVLSLEEEEVDVREAAESAVESLREKWEDGETTLIVELGQELPLVAGDSQALITVLRNLLENAWKYSQGPREITLGASEGDGELMLSVRDNGVGLSEKDKARIFNQFYRADRRLARAQDGLGLGLSIVQRLVEAMDGRVEVESREGEGSEFKIWLKIVR